MTAAEFVQLVGQYPCIYNSDLPEYARRDTTEKAWQEVADTLGWTATECKEKWKNIRNGFVRSLKASYKGGKKKPYYLCDEMQYLVPYINPAINIDKQRVPSPNDEERFNIDEIKQEKDIEIVIHPVTSRKRKAPTENETSSKNDDNALVTWLENKKTSMEDTRKMFLFSLLPDLRKLNDEQLAVFRIKMLLLLEEVKTLSGDSLKKLLKQMK